MLYTVLKNVAERKEKQPVTDITATKMEPNTCTDFPITYTATHLEFKQFKLNL